MVFILFLFLTQKQISFTGFAGDSCLYFHHFWQHDIQNAASVHASPFLVSQWEILF